MNQRVDRRHREASGSCCGQECPMPLAFQRLHPGGMADNSPTFQRRVREFRGAASTEGTAETLHDPSAVPPGLIVSRTLVPNVETLGYYHMSLRDNDLARFSGSSLVANPSGIAHEDLPGNHTRTNRPFAHSVTARDKVADIPRAAVQSDFVTGPGRDTADHSFGLFSSPGPAIVRPSTSCLCSAF